MSTDTNGQAPTLLDVGIRLQELSRDLEGKIRRLMGWRQRFLSGDFENPRFYMDDAGLGSLEIGCPSPGEVQQLLHAAIERQQSELYYQLREIVDLSLAAANSLVPRQSPGTPQPATPSPVETYGQLAPTA